MPNQHSIIRSSFLNIYREGNAMTQADMEALAAWQESPDGELFSAIDAIADNLLTLEDFMVRRDGIKQLRAYREDIQDLTERLQTVLYAATPKQVAAE